MKDGLQRVFDVLDLLDKKGIHYQIDQVRPGAIIVFFTVVGARVEVEFTPNGLSHKCYKGSEDVESDFAVLLAHIE